MINENVYKWKYSTWVAVTVRFAWTKANRILKKTISDNNSIVIVDFTDFEIRIRFCVIIDARNNARIKKFNLKKNRKERKEGVIF